MRQSKVLKKSQIIALEFCLSDFDRSMSYEQVLDAITNAENSVTIWEPFQYYDKDNVIEFIENLKYNIENNFKKC
jgi:hypothetical protein